MGAARRGLAGLRCEARSIKTGGLDCQQVGPSKVAGVERAGYHPRSRETRSAAIVLIVMKAGATADQVRAVEERVRTLGFSARSVDCDGQAAVVVTGSAGPIDPALTAGLAGVQEIAQMARSYRLVGRESRPADSVVEVGGRPVGGPRVCVIAGPCAVESERQALTIAEAVARAGADFFRGGAFKPRTSPYSFQGLGREGLRILSRVREATGLPIITEAVDDESMAMVEEHADAVQIGARNMQNYSLLKRAGRSRLPVFLKRGPAATLEELLLAAEYIAAGGNSRIFLFERGIRTFAHQARNTLDLGAVPGIKALSHLPVLVDPSHGTGMREKVRPLALAAIAAGADGIMVEVHHEPHAALCDGAQAILPDEFAALAVEVRRLAGVLGRDQA
jgi:3-deoxy-7-phosphoheptulonate synthase